MSRAFRRSTLGAALVLLVLSGCGERETEMPGEPIPTPRRRPEGGVLGTPTPEAPPAATPPTPATAEAPRTPPGSPAPAPSPSPAARAAESPAVETGAGGPAQGVAEQEIRSRIEAWRRAWQSKDLEAYLSFYDPGFEGDGLDLEGWRSRKERVFARAGKVEVGIQGLEVEVSGERAVVRFTQVYTSERHSDRGSKRLRLVRGPGGWRIAGEEFTP